MCVSISLISIFCCCCCRIHNERESEMLFSESSCHNVDVVVDEHFAYLFKCTRIRIHIILSFTMKNLRFIRVRHDTTCCENILALIQSLHILFAWPFSLPSGLIIFTFCIKLFPISQFFCPFFHIRAEYSTAFIPYFSLPSFYMCVSFDPPQTVLSQSQHSR